MKNHTAIVMDHVAPHVLIRLRARHHTLDVRQRLSIQPKRAPSTLSAAWLEGN
jgi:hypothetical protein